VAGPPQRLRLLLRLLQRPVGHGRSVAIHATIDFISRKGHAALAKGRHAVDLRYLHRDFVAGLTQKVDAPRQVLAPVGPVRLSRSGGDQ
jgi:hypothetical protein